ncbi:HNH endonuclease [Myxococcus sp. XM-1-1-1]|uniref:HNH endonuclease n=1 Tax=Myxococcus sp. XM-1-1-1 TaxID=2874602 RepID=UPI001CBADAA8|nr:HNH endonuclease [Myxococcus sp. XM-1-1-1]MBZ4414809.1 HNH endonuclease [Myxococcus sp. XM-1-1-1]
MSRCIYCLDPLVPKKAGESPKNPSLEHVVPWSLGGSNACATEEACCECNGKLGETVDSNCINQSIVSTYRHEFGIVGHGGTIPDIVLNVRSLDTNEPGLITIPYNGDISIEHKPVVIRQPKRNSEQILVAGSRKQVRNIMEGIEAKARKRGDRVTDTAGEEIDIDTAIASAIAEISTQYRIDWDYEMPPIWRELVKVAFGFGHLTLGWRWTESQRAEAMRRVARGIGDWRELEALIEGIRPEIRSILPPAENGRTTDHLICLMVLEKPIIVVSLFGSQLLSIAVRLDVDTDMLIEGLVETGRQMVTIDPRTRRSKWVGTQELVAYFETNRRTDS